MKIGLKVNADQLNFLSNVFDRYRNVTPLSFQLEKRESKFLTSICIEIADKFAAKFQTVARTPDLFDTKKKYKITLKFYQAHAVSLLMLKLKTHEADAYRRNMAEIIHNKIEPQLT